MHQRPNPIHFFFQREMPRVEKMELCTGNISFKEFSTLHRKDSIVFAPSDQRGGVRCSLCMPGYARSSASEEVVALAARVKPQRARRASKRASRR